MDKYMKSCSTKVFDFKNSNECEELNFGELASVIDNFDDEENLLLRIQRMEIEFAKNLIKLRKGKGLTQVDMAKKTGLTQQAISALEKCDRKPTLPNLIKYLIGLDIDINRLFN